MAGQLPDLRGPISWIIIALLIYLCALVLPPPAGLGHEGQAVLGVVFAGVVLWISEALPLGLTALLVLVLLGIVPTWKQSATFVGFASPVVFFLIGAANLRGIAANGDVHSPLQLIPLPTKNYELKGKNYELKGPNDHEKHFKFWHSVFDHASISSPIFGRLPWRI
jgi:hypothetical protein